MKSYMFSMKLVYNCILSFTIELKCISRPKKQILMRFKIVWTKIQLLEHYHGLITAVVRSCQRVGPLEDVAGATTPSQEVLCI